VNTIGSRVVDDVRRSCSLFSPHTRNGRRFGTTRYCPNTKDPGPVVLRSTRTERLITRPFRQFATRFQQRSFYGAVRETREYVPAYITYRRVFWGTIEINPSIPRVCFAAIRRYVTYRSLTTDTKNYEKLRNRRSTGRTRGVIRNGRRDRETTAYSGHIRKSHGRL